MYKYKYKFQPGTQTDVSVVPTITTTTADGLTYKPDERKCFQCEEVVFWLEQANFEIPFAFR